MTEPTYDELAKLFTEETGFDVDDFPAAILGFACAVLAKWGTPAVAEEPVAWYVTGGSRLLDENEAKAEARHIGGTARAIPVYTTPQPSPAAQGDALDALEAARQYGAESWDDWLKDKVDAAIDAARAAQEGKSHGN